MAAPSRETLQRIAAETLFQPATIEKVLRLLDLLQEIAGNNFLKTRLALKGGTALNLFYLDLERLSVDIDLNYVGALDREVMLAERPEVEANLQRILAAQGYGVRRQPDEHAGGKWVARYSSALGGFAALEVDANFMMREPLFGVALKDSASFGGAEARNVVLLDIHEIIAGKLVALLDRRAARDLFDARRIFDMPDVDWHRIKVAMLAFGASARRDWRQVSVASIDADPKELRDKLLLCLPRGRFREKGSIDAWIAEAADNCRTRLAPLLDWSPKERAFLDNVIERGVIDVSLLDVQPDIAARIERMPMLQWKAEHVGRYSRR